MKVFTLRKSDVGKLPFDFCSFGHLLYGYSVNLVAFFLYLMYFNFSEYFLAMSFTFSLWTSVFWEIIEEVNPIRMFGKDTLINSLMDILLTMIGTTLSHWWSFYNRDLYLVISIIYILGSLTLYQIFWKLTR